MCGTWSEMRVMGPSGWMYYWLLQWHWHVCFTIMSGFHSQSYNIHNCHDHDNGIVIVLVWWVRSGRVFMAVFQIKQPYYWLALAAYFHRMYDRAHSLKSNIICQHSTMQWHCHCSPPPNSPPHRVCVIMFREVGTFWHHNLLRFVVNNNTMTMSFYQTF